MIEGYGEFASLRQFIEVFFYFFCVKMTPKLFFRCCFGWFFEDGKMGEMDFFFIVSFCISLCCILIVLK